MIAGAVLALASASPGLAADAVKIGFITKFPVPFFATMENAAKEYAAANAGVEIVFGQGASATDIEGQIGLIESMVTQGVQGIALTPVDPTVSTALDKAVAALVTARRTGPAQPDLLQMLLDARDEAGATLTDRQLRDELVTLLVAGHETVASALTWAWALLAQHPATADRIAQEAGDAARLDPGSLPFTQAAFDEALRLYPPAWLITRRAAEADEVAGTPVSAGSLILISPYIVQRRAELWAEPDVFRPERFLGQPPPRFNYLPFGAGPRLCIGQSFARWEGTILLAALANRFRLEAQRPGLPGIEPLVTLRPHGGLSLTLKPRRTPDATTAQRT